MAWRLGFAALVLAVVGFAVWTVLVVRRVAQLRGQVENNIAWSQRAHVLERATAAWVDGGAGEVPPGWQAAADAMAADELPEAFTGASAAIARARAERTPAALTELQAALDGAMAQVRRDNAGHSAALGGSWSDISVIVFTALLLAGVVVVLVALVELRRRQALHLAAEIEATAEVLADTRAALREQRAVAQFAGELRVARDRAEEASAAKTRFMTTMSHELLTPLNIILGYAALVRERCEEHAVAEVGEDVDRLEDAAHGLHRLLRHVLDLTELDAKTLAIDLEDVELASLLERVAEEARPVAARNGTTLTVAAPAGLRLRCDRRRLTTVISEALGNACRFTRGGHVTLRAAVDQGRARVEVEDDGPGMREDDRARATAPFFQADASTTRAHDGAGLGLTVAARLCARMGGSLALRSAPGQGTTVTIEVPA